MNKEFIPYEQALELKELGFDKKCYGHYDSIGELNTVEDYVRLRANISEMLSKEFNSVSYMKEMCSAPLYQQAFRWFREKYGLYSEIFVDDNKTFGFYITSFIEEGRLDKPITRQFNTYEEAELGCVKQLIEIIDRKAEAYS